MKSFQLSVKRGDVAEGEVMKSCDPGEKKTILRKFRHARVGLTPKYIYKLQNWREREAKRNMLCRNVHDGFIWIVEIWGIVWI